MHYPYSKIKMISAAVLLLFSSCAQLNHLNQAQEAFNQGAELENRQLFPVTTSEGRANLDISKAIEQEMTNLSPTFYYAQSYAAIQKALEKEKALQEDNLLGNALALKALCEWKLKRYGQARLSAEAARNAFRQGAIPSPRDQAVMIALEGFIENDLAFNEMGALQKKIDDRIESGSALSTQAAPLFDEFQRSYRQNIHDPLGEARIEKAVQIIEKARKEINPNHPVQTYLLMSQLVCMKNWSDALNYADLMLKKLGLSGGNNEAGRWWKEEEERYTRQKTTYMEQLAGMLPKGDKNSVYQEWELLLY